MLIDAHVHFWRYDRDRLGWIDPAGVLAADHLPPAAVALAAAAGIRGLLAVQAEGSATETAWLLDLARAHPAIVGVVGWTDLSAPHVGEAVAALAARPGLVGLRHQVQDEPDDFLRRPEVVRGVRACAVHGLTYDLLVFGRQAPLLPGFLAAVGDGRFVLDHGGKPGIAHGAWQPWADAVRQVAAHPGTWCKLSGLVTEADTRGWRPSDIEPYMAHLLDCFGPERLIFGSDWPVCRLAAQYPAVHRLVDDFVARRCPDHRAAIFGGNARRAYRLDG